MGSAGGLGRLLVELAASAQVGGTALVGLFALLALAGEWLAHGMRRHAAQYAGGCAFAALASLVLVTAHNFLTGGANPTDAAVVYALYGACSLGLAARWRRPEFTYLGLALLAGSTLWVLWAEVGTVATLWATVMAAEALVMRCAGPALFSGTDRERNNWRIFTPLNLPSPSRGEGTADSYSFRGPKRTSRGKGTGTFFGLGTLRHSTDNQAGRKMASPRRPHGMFVASPW